MFLHFQHSSFGGFEPPKLSHQGDFSSGVSMTTGKLTVWPNTALERNGVGAVRFEFDFSLFINLTSDPAFPRRGSALGR